jgi:type IV pilus assembly protein PilB
MTFVREDGMARLRLGEMLVQRGCIDTVQLQSALAHQRRWGGRIGRSIVQLGFMKEPALLQNVGEQLGVPFLEIGDREIPRQVLGLLPERLIRARKAIPVERIGTGRRGPLVVALADPSDLGALDELAFATGMAVRPVLAAEQDLDRAIARLLDGVVARRPPAFQDRADAIELPEDTSPLPPARPLKGGGFGDGGFN